MQKKDTVSRTDDLKYVYFLSRIENIGNVRVKKLMSICPSYSDLLSLSKIDLKKIQGIDEKIAGDIIRSHDNSQAIENELEKIFETADKKGIKLVSLTDPEYPENLKQIFDAPVLLYYKGTLKPEDKYSISIVGTRYASEYGKNVCRKFVAGLAELKIPVISGFAKGIDSYAHAESIKRDNLTYAVFGCGVDVIYPAENKKLYSEVIEKGAVISEFNMEAFPDTMNFPKRNRIISGIGLGTIVIESGLKGGSLLTAGFALDQDKEVFAVPGPVNAKFSEGTNELIKKGHAKLVTKIDDVLIELDSKLKRFISNNGRTVSEPDTKGLNVNEKKIFSVLNDGPQNIDMINELTGLSVSDCLVSLLSLEFKAFIRQMPGKNFTRI